MKRDLRQALFGAVAWVAACNVYDATLIGLGVDDGNEAGAPGTAGDGNGPAGSPGEAGMPGSAGGEGGAPIAGTGNPDPQGGNPPIGGTGGQGGTAGTSSAGDAGDAGEGGQGGNAGAPGCTPKPPSILRDADEDGIIDVFDDDDDNDGIPDLEECFPTATRFVNPGFETPVVTLARGWDYVPQALVPGWDTNAANGALEIWSTLGPAAVGNQHIEVSTQQPDTVGQVITTVPGTTLRWGFHFRSRDSARMDIVQVLIGPPGTTVQQGQFTTGTVWQIYEGEYVVPAGQTSTRFEFRGVPDEVTLLDTSHIDHVDAEPICTRDSDGDGCVDSEDPD